MPYSDGAACHGRMYHATIDDSDCHQQLSTALTSMHASWATTAPCAGDGCGWGDDVGMRGYLRHMVAVRQWQGGHGMQRR